MNIKRIYHRLLRSSTANKTIERNPKVAKQMIMFNPDIYDLERLVGLSLKRTKKEIMRTINKDIRDFWEDLEHEVFEQIITFEEQHLSAEEILQEIVLSLYLIEKYTNYKFPGAKK